MRAICMPLKRFPRQKTNTPQKAKSVSSVLFAGNPLPMWIYDVDSLRFLEVNESAVRQYGYTREEFLSLTLNDIRPSRGTLPIEQTLQGRDIDPDKTWINVKKDGTSIHVNVRANDVRYLGKRARYVVAEDVTETRSVQAELVRLAHHDALTGLPNRVLLEQRMREAFDTAQKNNHRAAIICLDLDRFKQVNDWYGHAIGDECLKKIAAMLTRRLRGMDTVARTGGEEFALLLGEVESVAAAGIVAKALLQAFSSPIEVEGQSVFLGASMGVAVFPDHGTEAATLRKSADAAMYRAKRAGGSRHVLVASDHSTAAVESEGIHSHMVKSLKDGGFLLHYQLQYDVNHEIHGMEALLRLPHADLGFVSPDRFIPVAEDNGLIHPIGKWVIEEACRQLMLWNTNRKRPVCIAVNVSPLQLMRPDFASEVREAIAQSGIDPTWLEMEITERVMLNFDEIAKRMASIADMGIRFAVDDFGTGYSSLQHLQRLPISTLKIDRSFVQQLSESSRSYPIVKAIIAMGHSLQMQVVAEGVETEDQLGILRKLDCDSVQGFLWSRPAPPEVIETILAEEQSARSKYKEPERKRQPYWDCSAASSTVC